MHRCESCSGTATLKQCLDQELNEHEDDEKCDYDHWDTTYKEYKDAIDDLIRHSYVAKLKITNSL